MAAPRFTPTNPDTNGFEGRDREHNIWHIEAAALLANPSGGGSDPLTVHEPFVVQDGADGEVFSVIDDPDAPGQPLLRLNVGGSLAGTGFVVQFADPFLSHLSIGVRDDIDNRSILDPAGLIVLGGGDRLFALDGNQLAFGANGSETAIFTPTALTIGAAGALQVVLDPGGNFGLAFLDANGDPVGQWVPGNGDITVYDQPTGHFVAQVYNEGDEGELDLAKGGVTEVKLKTDGTGLTLYDAAGANPAVLSYDNLVALLALI